MDSINTPRILITPTPSMSTTLITVSAEDFILSCDIGHELDLFHEDAASDIGSFIESLSSSASSSCSSSFSKDTSQPPLTPLLINPNHGEALSPISLDSPHHLPASPPTPTEWSPSCIEAPATPPPPQTLPLTSARININTKHPREVAVCLDCGADIAILVFHGDAAQSESLVVEIRCLACTKDSSSLASLASTTTDSADADGGDLLPVVKTRKLGRRARKRAADDLEDGRGGGGGGDARCFCEVCTHLVGHGGVRNITLVGRSREQKKWEHIDMDGVEIICAKCVRDFDICTYCGSSSTRFRTGRWRPRQLFLPNRSTCILPHPRYNRRERDKSGLVTYHLNPTHNEALVPSFASTPRLPHDPMRDVPPAERRQRLASDAVRLCHDVTMRQSAHARCMRVTPAIFSWEKLDRTMAAQAAARREFILGHHHSDDHSDHDASSRRYATFAYGANSEMLVGYSSASWNVESRHVRFIDRLTSDIALTRALNRSNIRRIEEDMRECRLPAPRFIWICVPRRIGGAAKVGPFVEVEEYCEEIEVCAGEMLDGLYAELAMVGEAEAHEDGEIYVLAWAERRKLDMYM